MEYSGQLIRAKEKAESITILRQPEDDDDTPAYRCRSYRVQLPDLLLVRDVYGGTKTLRAGKKKYLPKHPMETDKKHEARLDRAVAFNALRKTIEGLVGMVFRRDPVLGDDIPEQIRAHLENVDLRGNALPIFLRDVACDALLDGHCWVHVDAPRGGAANRAQSEALGIRPYWVRITKQRAINWRYEIRNGRPVLTLFAYEEEITKPDGKFGEKTVRRVRVLRDEGSVAAEVWELRENARQDREWVMVPEESGPVETDEIPVVFVASERDGEFASRPPLLDLAYEQIEHYNVRSDRQTSLSFSAVAVPYLFGEGVTDKEGNSQVRWGADGMLLHNDPTTKAGVVESTGAGLDAMHQELEAIKENMASLGLRFLARQPNPQPRTATAELLEKSESNAPLSAFATGLEDATNLCLMFHADYERQTVPGTIEINRDFQEQILEPQFIQVLADLVATSKLSLETLWDILIAGELLPEEFDPEEELQRIEADGSRGMGGAVEDLLSRAQQMGGQDEDEDDAGPS